MSAPQGFSRLLFQDYEGILQRHFFDVKNSAFFVDHFDIISSGAISVFGEYVLGSQFDTGGHSCIHHMYYTLAKRNTLVKRRGKQNASGWDSDACVIVPDASEPRRLGRVVGGREAHVDLRGERSVRRSAQPD